MAADIGTAALESIHRRELNELENLKVHTEIRVAAALDYCAENHIRPPAWLTAASAVLLLDLLKREKAQQRGRKGNCITRYRRDQWDVERWDAVEEARRMKKSIRADIQLRRKLGATSEQDKGWQYRQRQLAWFGHGIFECASRLLAGRDARVGAEAMKASYRRCKDRAGRGPLPDRYYLFNEDFLLKLGIPRLSERKPGTKFVHLFDLT
jgi:hypothetical protein